MREVQLNGGILKVSAAPFAEAKALYQAFLREFKGISIGDKTMMAEVYKNIFCLGFSSPGVEAALKPCLERCTYNFGKGDMKITDTSFEEEKCREDYVQVCTEVAKENVMPFMKSLYAGYEQALAMMQNTRV